MSLFVTEVALVINGGRHGAVQTSSVVNIYILSADESVVFCLWHCETATGLQHQLNYTQLFHYIPDTQVMKVNPRAKTALISDSYGKNEKPLENIHL